MPARVRVLVTGAAGAGTSSIARALAAPLGAAAIEADDCHWLPTKPPYRQARAVAERGALLRAMLDAAPRAVVAGSIVGWGRELEDGFDLIVFVLTDARVRLERLRVREVARFGRADPQFLDWAAQYDTGTTRGRNLARHRAWLAQRSTPILELDGAGALSASVAAIAAALQAATS